MSLVAILAVIIGLVGTIFSLVRNKKKLLPIFLVAFLIGALYLAAVFLLLGGID